MKTPRVARIPTIHAVALLMTSGSVVTAITGPAKASAGPAPARQMKMAAHGGGEDRRGQKLPGRPSPSTPAPG
jgi:Spy/CpxP family protein refolding chaperone